MPIMKQNNDDLLEWIEAFLSTRKYAPTVREVAAYLGRGVSTTHTRLTKLQDEGKVTWNEGETRTLRVTR